MHKVHRLSLALKEDDELQAKAYEILRAAPYGSRTNLICRAICAYENNAILLDEIRKIVQEESAQANFNSMRTIQPNIIEPKAESVNSDVLGFLRSLEEGELE